MGMLRRINSIVITTALVISTSIASVSARSLPLFSYGSDAAPALGLHRYIVRYRDASTALDIEALLAKNGAVRHKRLSTVFNGDVLDLTPGQARQLAKATTHVLWVESDQQVQSQTNLEPSPSWGLDRIDQRTLPVNNIYSYSTSGSGVDAYVVDSGVLASHSQFTGRVRLGFDAFGGNAIDCNGHGTHVAGILAGSSFGVAPQANVIAVRVLDCAGGGTVSGVISAIDWVVADHTTRPAVMNLSLGTSQSASFESAVDRAFADGIVVVAAAGNSNVDACTTSPSGDRASVLSVGASNEADSRASFSNFGKCLDLFAPGTNIISAGISSNSATALMSGTSMAAPHVAGLVARYLSTATTASPSLVMDAITASATPNGITNAGTLSPTLLAFGDPEFIPASPPSTSPNTPGAQPLLSPLTPGTGTASSPSAPGAIGKVTAIADNSSSWLSWMEGSNGGSPISAHVVRVYKNKQFVSSVFVDAETFHLMSDLLAARSYSFTVASINGYGVGPFSPRSNTIVPLLNTGKYGSSNAEAVANSLPATPRHVATHPLGHRTIAITWSSTRTSAASSFQVWFYRSHKVIAKVTTVYNGGLKLYGFTPGKYAVRVRAINDLGESTLTRARTVTIR